MILSIVVSVLAVSISFFSLFLSQNSTKNQLLSLYDNTTKNSPDQDSTYQLPTQSAA
ncbi:hypothetical protein GW750_02180 [bacterium]|nr:hypothetical protein [bacterium]